MDQNKTKLTVISCLVLVVATLATYSRVRNNPFAGFDDQTYIVRNLHVQGGVTWKTVSWAFTSTEQSNWHRLTSLFLHTLNVLLLFLLLLKAAGCRWRSLLVAALFALHPFNVESVAWIAE